MIKHEEKTRPINCGWCARLSPSIIYHSRYYKFTLICMHTLKYVHNLLRKKDFLFQNQKNRAQKSLSNSSRCASMIIFFVYTLAFFMIFPNWQANCEAQNLQKICVSVHYFIRQTNEWNPLFCIFAGYNNTSSLSFKNKSIFILF